MSRILFESDATADIQRLVSAWSAEETFALLPDKPGQSYHIIESALDALPRLYRSGHYALMTSGSTGQPKLVIGSRDRSESLARLLHELQQSEQVNAAIVALPLSYSYSFVNQFLWARLHNRGLVLTHGLARPDEFYSALSTTNDAMLCLVGSQVPLLIKYFESGTFPGVIRLHFAGGRFPSESLDHLRRLFPNALIFNNYGCAEALPRLTLRLVGADKSASHVGWPLPGVEIKVSLSGEILFRSPYGAVAQSDENGLRPIGGEEWVPTGDVGSIEEDGHLELGGRSSEVFKRYGEKISIPVILQSIASAWKGRAGAYREADRLGEEGYVLIVAPHPSNDEVRSILKVLRGTYSRSHWPLRLESLDELPLLPNGKFDTQGAVHQAGLRPHWRQPI